MAKEKGKEIKLTATEKLVKNTESWLGKNVKLIAIILTALLALVIVVAVISGISSSSEKKLMDKLVALEAIASEYGYMDDEDENLESTRNSLRAAAEDLYRKPGVKKYAGARAGLLLSALKMDEGDFQGAAEICANIAEGQKKTYMRQVALMTEAVCLEEVGNKSSALSIYNQLFDEYGVEGIYASRALFNVARLTEETDVKLAISIYEQLVGEFLDYGSEYAKLAKTRIAQLNQ